MDCNFPVRNLLTIFVVVYFPHTFLQAKVKKVPSILSSSMFLWHPKLAFLSLLGGYPKQQPISPYLYICTKTVPLKNNHLRCVYRGIKRKEHAIQEKILAVYRRLNSLTNGKTSLIRNPYWKHTQNHKDSDCPFSN